MMNVDDCGEWNPEQYAIYANERARPANDLMDRIPLRDANEIVDLGCGAGQHAVKLSQRFSSVRVLGVDSSPEMLEQARSRYRGMENLEWHQVNIQHFAPETSVDLIFSNAALHWLPDHGELFPRLASWLNPGGVLAVQMPNNYDAPSHRLMYDVALSRPWQDRFKQIENAPSVLTVAEYYDRLSPIAKHVDIWETVYTHVLDGEDPVANWTRSTGLRPFLAVLENERDRDGFFREYADKIRRAYPSQADGRTLFPFRRMFMVVTV